MWRQSEGENLAKSVNLRSCHKYCSRCCYPLVPSAFDEIKEAENVKLLAMQEKYDTDIAVLKEAVQDMQQLLKNPTKLADISNF